jgi:phage terminase small subunit
MAKNSLIYKMLTEIKDIEMLLKNTIIANMSKKKLIQTAKDITSKKNNLTDKELAFVKLYVQNLFNFENPLSKTDLIHKAGYKAPDIYRVCHTYSELLDKPKIQEAIQRYTSFYVSQMELDKTYIYQSLLSALDADITEATREIVLEQLKLNKEIQEQANQISNPATNNVNTMGNNTTLIDKECINNKTCNNKSKNKLKNVTTLNNSKNSLYTSNVDIYSKLNKIKQSSKWVKSSNIRITYDENGTPNVTASIQMVDKVQVLDKLAKIHKLYSDSEANQNSNIQFVMQFTEADDSENTPDIVINTTAKPAKEEKGSNINSLNNFLDEGEAIDNINTTADDEDK